MLQLLIADASEALRLGLRMIFSIDPQQINVVAEASSVIDLLQLTHTHRPDVIIVDGDMAGFDTALSQMSEQCRDCALIVLTMQTNPEFKRIMLQSGATCCLEKRASPDELLKVIHRVRLSKMTLPLAA